VVAGALLTGLWEEMVFPAVVRVIGSLVTDNRRKAVLKSSIVKDVKVTMSFIKHSIHTLSKTTISYSTPS
jgi:hypothetical protein